MAIESFEQGYNWVWLLFTGLFATGIGVFMVIDPDMGMKQPGPRVFTDYLTGLGAILAGIIILAFCVYVVRKREHPEQK